MSFETGWRVTRRHGPRRILSMLAGLVLLSIASCQTPSESAAPLEVVESVDLDRYLGRWYEIASFPQFFQRGCVASRAEYSRRKDGRIRVLNRCRDGTLDAAWREAEGVAWVVDPEVSSARLVVSFFWPFKGDYWIIDLGADYEYAVVGHPDRTYLWILSRTPTLPDDVYAGILERILAKGYDLTPLTRTLQSATGTHDSDA